MEVMRLREENDALMDSLVRTKVELAEIEGEAPAAPSSQMFCPLGTDLDRHPWTSIKHVSHCLPAVEPGCLMGHDWLDT